MCSVVADGGMVWVHVTTNREIWHGEGFDMWQWVGTCCRV